MTGPEHYQEAENCLIDAENSELGSEAEAHSTATAQVHATLALAAATALGVSHRMSFDAQVQQWLPAIGHEVTR